MLKALNCFPRTFSTSGHWTLTFSPDALGCGFKWSAAAFHRHCTAAHFNQKKKNTHVKREVKKDSGQVIMAFVGYGDWHPSCYTLRFNHLLMQEYGSVNVLAHTGHHWLALTGQRKYDNQLFFQFSIYLSTYAVLKWMHYNYHGWFYFPILPSLWQRTARYIIYNLANYLKTYFTTRSVFTKLLHNYTIGYV